MEFHGANGDVHHDTIRCFLPHRGLDVHEFLSAHVGSEPCFGHHVVGAGQGQAIADDRRIAVCNVRERATVDEGRIAFQGLYKIGEGRRP